MNVHPSVVQTGCRLGNWGPCDNNIQTVVLDTYLLRVFRVYLEDSACSSRLQQQYMFVNSYCLKIMITVWHIQERSKTVLTSDEYSVLKKRYSLFGGLCVFLSALHNHCSAEILMETGTFNTHTSNFLYSFLLLHNLIPYTAVKHPRSEGQTLTHVSQQKISLHLSLQGNVWPAQRLKEQLECIFFFIFFWIIGITW